MSASDRSKTICNSHCVAPAAIFIRGAAGDIASLYNVMWIRKVLSLLRGLTKCGFHSYEQELFAELATPGSVECSSREDLLNSKLIVLWTRDPANTVLGTNTGRILAQAQ